MASRSFFEDELSCPVCCEIFINPVVLSCSHSICEDCIQRFWVNKRKECPVCRRRSSREHPPLNLVLKNLCESYQQKRRSSSGGEIVCSIHKEKLKLFCLDDQEPVCLVCRDSRKHLNHRFCPVDEAVMDNKEILEAKLKHLQETLRRYEIHDESLCNTAEDFEAEAQQTERQIKEEFEELHQFLHNEEASRITTLREEKEQKSQIIMKDMEETSKQISTLKCTIRDIEEQMNAEDDSFLQNFNSTLQRAQRDLPDPELNPAVTINVTNHLNNLKLNVLHKMRENVDKMSNFNIDHSDVTWALPAMVKVSSVTDKDYEHFGRRPRALVVLGQHPKERPLVFPGNVRSLDKTNETPNPHQPENDMPKYQLSRFIRKETNETPNPHQPKNDMPKNKLSRLIRKETNETPNPHQPKIDMPKYKLSRLIRKETNETPNPRQPENETPLHQSIRHALEEQQIRHSMLLLKEKFNT